MKSFFNYTKNRFLYSVIKFFVFLLIAYLLANCLNIQTVSAQEQIICEYTSNANFSYTSLTKLVREPEKNIVDAYSDALELFKKNVSAKEYVVSLELYDPVTYEEEDRAWIDEFAFYFRYDNLYTSYSGSSLNASFTLWSTNVWKFVYRYDSSSDSYDYSSSNSSKLSSYSVRDFNSKSFMFISGEDYCSTNPLMFFTGTVDLKIPDSYSYYEVFYPVYNVSNYNYVSLSGSSTIPYITDTYLPEIANMNYKELSLDTSDFLVLWPKEKTAKDYTMFFKGMVCPTAVYNYGTLANSDNTNRCTIDYSEFTRNTFSVIQSDIDNNAIYYFKGYKKGASIKINASDWNYKFINYDQDHTLTINGTTYELLNYTEKDLPNNAVTNEKNNVVPGSSDNFFDNVLDGVKALFRSVTSFFDSFFSSFLNVLSGFFLPPDGYLDNFVTTLKVMVEQKLGLLVYPFQFFGDICNRIINFTPTNTSGTIHIPEVKDPFYGVTLVEPQVLVLSDIFNTGSLKTAYNTYLYVVDLYLIFGFLNLCYKKFYEFICSNPVGGDNT